VKYKKISDARALNAPDSAEVAFMPDGTPVEPVVAPKAPAMEAIARPRGRRRFDYPGNGTGKVKPHRAGTKRALVVEMLTREGGATFLEVQEAIAAKFPGGEWDDRTCFEGIKLVSVALGYELTEDPSTAVIRAKVS
jgi:hypothetical protein